MLCALCDVAPITLKMLFKLRIKREGERGGASSISSIDQDTAIKCFAGKGIKYKLVLLSLRPGLRRWVHRSIFHAQVCICVFSLKSSYLINCVFFFGLWAKVTMGEKVSGSQISHSKSKMSFYSFRSCHSSSFSPCSGLLLEARRISHSTKNTIISHHTWWKKRAEIWSHWCVISSLFCTQCLLKMLLRHSSDSYFLLLSQLLILCCYSDSTYEESLSVCWLVSCSAYFLKTVVITISFALFSSTWGTRQEWEYVVISIGWS